MALLNIIILLGALQGFILTFLLFVRKQGNRIAHRLLAWLILIISLACFNLYASEAGLDHYQTFRLPLELLPFVLAMAFGPLLYFYCRSLIEPGFTFGRKERLHLIPVLLDLVPSITAWIFVIGLIAGIFKQEEGAIWGNFIDEYNAYVDIPRWMSLTFYTWRAWTFLQKRAQLPAVGQKDNYRWLTILLKVFVIFQIGWLAFLVPYIIPAYRYRLLDFVGWYPLYVPLAVMIYWIGIKGYFQNSTSAAVAPPIPPEVVKATIIALTRAMEKDKLYLDADLTVASLGTFLAIPARVISGVLNQHLNSNFNEFVNQHRVREIQKRLLDQSHQHLTIGGLALECGFSSQATFQRVFRQITHQTPSEYLVTSGIRPAESPLKS